MTDQKKGGLKSKLKAMLFAHGPKMITCREFEDFVLDYLEDNLPIGQKKIFELHLRFCRECRDYLKAYQASMAVGQRLFAEEQQSLPEDVPEDIIQGILAARNS